MSLERAFGIPAVGRIVGRGAHLYAPRPHRHPRGGGPMSSLVAAVSVGDSLQRGLDNLIGFLPRLIGFLIILAIGYIIARVAKGIVTKLLEKVGVDRAVHTGTTGEYVNRVAPGF